jgi:hypothetical protein
MASKAEVRAVRRVLYDRERLRRMLTEVRSIDILMNTNQNASLPPDDIRVTAGDGPTWVLLDGSMDPGVLEAAARCRRVAELLRQTRRALKDVDFDPGDRRRLRAALGEHARAWIARADAWSAPRGAVDPAVAADQINRHDASAMRGYRKVRAYLDGRALEGVL